ncbi:MAG: 30S ribosomal protein S8 [Bacteroidota bacterium]|jgi:small subunit ribosomal protein S8
MPVTDTIADFITRIRNAGQARHKFVVAPASKLNLHIANILSDQGFIGEVSSIEEDNQKFIKVGLKYYEGKPVIQDIQRVSKPGRRIYSPVEKIPRVSNGLGISIISTSKGLMTDKQARAYNVGGEIICKVR